jgi:hypothetical protein
MPSTLRKSSITPRQREGRAINVVADLLRRTLRVPNIYLEPPPSVIAADVLAVDSGGAGDLHAVEIELSDTATHSPSLPRASVEVENSLALSRAKKIWRERLPTIHRQLMAMPAHFRYLALPEDIFLGLKGEVQFGLFSDDGIGRLGVITVKGTGEEDITAEIAVRPERFRLDPAKLRAIETKILAKSRPDIEVRI